MVEVYNNQEVITLRDTLLNKLEQAAQLALPLALEHSARDGGVLPMLDVVEVSIVDDHIIDQVHRDFMDISGATDVITFAHGEIVLSVETAQAYAKEYGNDFSW